ncbi:MerR family transcriptional regulator [Streptomyces caniscabiei]|uniref:MerR family transcriptional regulator n=1 Tax=Streptomyces caniscabiei TaxID=2746961 RepID=A0A927LCU7_9ACTN|nr:MerR family transcriptional regulator [Streptomyces caniscabiei]MBD9703571.1 MerR family transcriptional regulator [Streptomyces caniscabiei]MBD9726668.1 MerR family transcriptional regulator [Streptomyces caniscabiei]MDX3514769.1 MerR family transcriptional regulator [Streptomyces caniscabiei]MDX3723742.1 MerR family transcriptional regulator [Streptomyces caniscabiei]MDX3731366.1 MerR family transcriptional regulator [Streptomyces caniscabiei]
MRISELSRRSEVSVATIKYYLREGLLPAGRQISATQAEYDESHVRRLRLIRALIGVRGLSVSTTRELLGALAEHAGDTHLQLGLALGAIRLTEESAEAPSETGKVDALVEELGWNVHESAPARAVLAETLTTLRTLGAPLDWQVLLPYARLAERTATLDLDQLEGIEDSLEAAERALLLTVLLEPALLALRRMAQENESARRYAGGQ